MKRDLKTEILSGLVVAISLIPESIGFSFVLGVDPLVGIFTSIIMGIVTSLVGGRPGMITAATGAVAAVYIGLVGDYGIEYLFLAVILSGILQLILAFLNVGSLVRLVSKPIMLGFLNGLAVIIFMAQINQFKIPGTESWLAGADMIIMILLVVLTMSIVMFLPRVFTAIPSTLVAIVVVTIISIVISKLGFNVYTVFDYAGGSIGGSIPLPNLPKVDYNLATLGIIFVPALSAAIVGIIESLLTLNILDEVTDSRGNTKKELKAQGLANLIAGIFGGMGGCALLGQSNINVNNGARTYISSFTAAFALFVIIMFASPLLEVIPLGVLAGIMFGVVLNTFAWETIYLKKVANNSDLLIALIVTIVVVVTHNLALGVLLGVIISVFKFAWDKSTKLSFSVSDDILYVDGLLFFASTDILKETLATKIFKKIDLSKAKVVDYSAASEIKLYLSKNENIELINVDEDSKHKLSRLNKK